MKYIFTLVALCATLLAGAQKLRTGAGQLSFGTKFRNETASVNLNIYNDGGFDLTGVKLKTFNKDFYVSDTLIDIAAQSFKQVTVTFNPRHNINYNTELLISSNSPYGSLSVDLKGTGIYKEGLYAPTQNLWEEDLRNALKTISAQGAQTLGYTGVRDQMYAYVDQDNDSVTCIYTGRRAKFSDRNGANNNNFTAEHSFPRSKYNSTDPMFSDIHHLFPADGPANTQRSNDPYGVVVSPNWSVGGSKSDNIRFEPRDYHKGTAARAIFYFVTRHGDFQNFYMQMQDVLKQWSAEHPVSKWDSARHERAAQVQGNRNPYIDHPEFIERITNFVGTSVATPLKELYVSNTSLNLGRVVFGDTAVAYIYLESTGNQTVLVNSYTIPNTASPVKVSMNAGDTIITPGDAKPIKLMAINNFAGTYNDTLVIVTNETNRSTIRIPLSYKFSNLGINSVSANAVKLYPNPASGCVTISGISIAAAPASADFYDVTGRMVYSAVLNNDFTELNISHLTKGCYFVHVNDGNSVAVIKLVTE